MRPSASLPEWCDLIIGDVGETIPWLHRRLRDRRLAFVAFDLDLYSSTVRTMPLLAGAPALYLPAVPRYFDDTSAGISHRGWAGEKLALPKFNEAHTLRKISWPLESLYHIRRSFVLQVLDNPLRQGKVRPRNPFQPGPIWDCHKSRPCVRPVPVRLPHGFLVWSAPPIAWPFCMDATIRLALQSINRRLGVEVSTGNARPVEIQLSW